MVFVAAEPARSPTAGRQTVPVAAAVALVAAADAVGWHISRTDRWDSLIAVS